MNRQNLNRLSALFGWSFVTCIGLQLFAFAMLTTMHDFAYDLHSRFFSISPEAFDIATYSTLGAMKTLGLTCFLCPWVATKIVANRIED